MPSLMLSLDYFSKAIDQGAPSPTVSLRGPGNGRDPCDLPLESLRIRDEDLPHAAFANLRVDFIGAEARAWSEGQVAHYKGRTEVRTRSFLSDGAAFSDVAPASGKSSIFLRRIVGVMFMRVNAKCAALACLGSSPYVSAIIVRPSTTHSREVEVETKGLELGQRQVRIKLERT
jgi:hypothetical protein